MLRRPFYIAAYTVAYMAAAWVLGFVVLVVWWLVAASEGQFACDGAWGPCGSLGRFTSDYWWLIEGGAAVLIALAALPIYRRLLQSAGGENELEIGRLSDASQSSIQHQDPPSEFR